HFLPYASPPAYGHTGWTGTVTVIDPTYDLDIILLTNARHTAIKGTQIHSQVLGKQYDPAQYGSLVSLIYAAQLPQ
ncbi:penicillin binding protein PBP4B, partial [Pseudoalteromonas sp. S3785]